MRNRRLPVVLAVATLLAGAAAAGLSAVEQPSAAKYAVKQEHNVRVPMRDGVHLATDLYVPAKDGQPVGQKLPAVLLRTPYGKGGFASQARLFAESGYLVAIQDCRGRFDSEGEFFPFRDDPQDGNDTDFFVKLVDEYPASADYPQGYGFPVCDGILRARYRDGFERPKLMEAGKVYRIEIPLEPSANMFAAGHRIRLDVYSSSFPNFDINPNTGNPNDRRPRVARNTIHHDGRHASLVRLPLCRLPLMGNK